MSSAFTEYGLDLRLVNTNSPPSLVTVAFTDGGFVDQRDLDAGIETPSSAL